LLLILSLSYQYHWILLLMLPVLLLTGGRASFRDTLVTLAGAVVVYLAGSAVIRLALIWGQLDPVTNPGADPMVAVSNPALLLAARIEEFRTGGDVRAFLPRWDHILATIQVYHPWVFAFGVGGLLLCGRRVGWLALVASVASLLSYMLYPAPWTAMSAYPLLYIGAGVGCCAAGSALGAASHAVIRGHGRLRWSRTTVGAAIATICAAVLAAATNLDLVGRHEFALAWWWLYFVPPVF
jgi:hypothetical protein